jgi:uncharacterized repeat protein (TIGR03803 family)
MIRIIAGGIFFMALWVPGFFLPAQAQGVATALHSFTGPAGVNFTNADGALPFAGLLLSGSTLYGTTFSGGTNGNGAVFAVTTNASTFASLHSFTTKLGTTSTNKDGANPNASLILSGSLLFGTAQSGGTNGNGAIFAVSTNGIIFTNLHSFTFLATNSSSLLTNKDGAGPNANLLLSGNTLYGSAFRGGTNGNGTLFAMNTNGTAFTNLHSFTATVSSTNNDGAHPHTSLVLSGTRLYGTTTAGGTNGNGTVFAVNTNGASFATLHHFTATAGASLTNNDGASPQAGLLLVGGVLYGTTQSGGTNGNGTVFAVSTNGSVFTILHHFTATSGSMLTNADGASPNAGVILSGGTLMGTTYSGGANGNGTVFAVNTNGTGFAAIYQFTATPVGTNNEGASPNAGLILLDNTLFGTAASGGGFGEGAVFSLNLTPPLAITQASGQAIVSWPTWSPNFQLQTKTNLISGSWSNLITGVITNGVNYQRTNLIGAPAAFFRLQSQ